MSDIEIDGGVIAKLKAHKDTNSGFDTITLPETGVMFAYPQFRNHGKLAAASRAAKGDSAKAQTMYIVRNCKFDGETITVNDFNELIPVADSTLIVKTLFGDEEGDDAGN